MDTFRKEEYMLSNFKELEWTTKKQQKLECNKIKSKLKSLKKKIDEDNFEEYTEEYDMKFKMDVLECFSELESKAITENINSLTTEMKEHEKYIQNQNIDMSNADKYLLSTSLKQLKLVKEHIDAYNKCRQKITYLKFYKEVLLKFSYKEVLHPDVYNIPKSIIERDYTIDTFYDEEFEFNLENVILSRREDEDETTETC